MKVEEWREWAGLRQTVLQQRRAKEGTGMFSHPYSQLFLRQASGCMLISQTPQPRLGETANARQAKTQQMLIHRSSKQKLAEHLNQSHPEKCKNPIISLP